MTDELPPLPPASPRSRQLPLGEIVIAGHIAGGHGVAVGTTRRHPVWGLTFVTAGTGRYVDADHDEAVKPGTLILVHPHHPHWYGADGEGWDEDFVVFSGPIFDAAARRGLLSLDRPLIHGLPITRWSRRLARFREPAESAVAQAAQAAQLLALMLEAIAWRDDPRMRPGTATPSLTTWLADAQRSLKSELTEPVDLKQLARGSGMPYETWRRRFRAETGSSPYAYRSEARLAAATDLLVHTGLSIRDIAATTGFSDQRHFIRRFRAVHGVTPTAYRHS